MVRGECKGNRKRGARKEGRDPHTEEHSMPCGAVTSTSPELEFRLT